MATTVSPRIDTSFSFSTRVLYSISNQLTAQTEKKSIEKNGGVILSDFIHY